MEGADLLYSGLMLAATLLTLWVLLLLSATLVVATESLRKSAPSAATISSENGALARASSKNGPEEPASSSSLPQTLPQRSILGRTVRLIQ